MASNVADLLIKITADAGGVASGLGAARSALSGFGAQARGVGTALSAGVTAPLTGLGIAALKGAGDLQQAVANISTIKPEIDTSAVFSALNDMSTRVPQSASQLGGSLYNIFSSMSVDTAGALSLVETFAKGAVGAGTDAATFGTAVIGVMNAYGLSVDQAGKVSDVFFNTVAAGVVTGQELATSLGPVTQAAKAAGVTVDQLGGFIAGITREGGPAAQNINNLNNFFQKITTKEAQAAIRGLGVATTDSAGAFRPITDVLTDLKPKLAGMTEAARANALQAIFPDAQARQGALTLLSQLDMVKQAIADNQNVSGVAESAYTKMAGTFNSQTALLKNGVMSVFTSIGATVLPLITPLITTLGQELPGVIERVRGFFDQLPEPVTKFALAFGLVLTAAGPLILGIGAIIPVIAALISPIGLVVIAIGALVAAFASAPGAFDALKTLFTEGDFGPLLTVLETVGTNVKNKVLEWGAAFLGWIGPRIVPMLEEAGQLLEQIVTWAKEEGLPALGSALVAWGTAFVEWVAPYIPPLLAALGDLLRRMGGWIVTTAVPEIVSGLIDWGKAFVEWVGPRIPLLIAALNELNTRLGSWITDTAGPAIKDKLIEWGKAFVEWITTDVLPQLPGKLAAILSTIGAWITGDALPWAGRALLSVGEKIVEGLIAGLRAKFDSVKNTLGELTNLIPAWKGPEATDERLLWGVGQQIIGGLVRGMESQYPAVQGSLQQLTKEILAGPWGGNWNGVFGGGGGAGGGGGGGGAGGGGMFETVENVNGVRGLFGVKYTGQSGAQGFQVTNADWYLMSQNSEWVKAFNQSQIGAPTPPPGVPFGSGRPDSTITVTINGDIYGQDDFEAKVGQAVKNVVQRGGLYGVVGAA